MANETKTIAKKETKMETKVDKVENKTESKVVAPATNETKTEVKTESKIEKKPIVKKEEAIAKGTNMPISKKHAMYICDHIKGKSIDVAIKLLNDVILFKRVIPMNGEIPHRSAPGVMSGRYPISASKQFIYLLKALKGNAIANGLDISKTRIYFGSATWDSRPARRGGTRFKRAFVLLKAKEQTYKETKEGKKQ